MIILWNKQKGTGGSGGSGKGGFPIIVNGSGTVLPTAQAEGEKFLKTDDKKLYTALANSYGINSNFSYSISDNLLDVTTGILDFSGGQYSLGITSYSDASYSLICPFVATNIEDTQCVLQAYSSGYPYNYYNIMIDSGKLYLKMTELCNIEVNKTYIIEIVVTGSIYATERSGVVKVYTEEGTKIAEDTFSYSASSVIVRFGYYSQAGPAGSFFTGKIFPKVGEYNFKLGANDIVIVDTSSLNWDSGTSLTDKTEYADKTNGILYLYENDELVAINTPSSFSSITGNATDNTSLATALSNKKDKAETITISTASVTIANVQANKNYVLSSSALTDITLTACETSFEETSINFTTGSSAPTFTDNASIKWFGGVPEMKANTTYTIVIFNKQAYWQEQENV